MGCFNSKPVLPERLVLAMRGDDVQYMLWKECAKDLVAAYNNQDVDLLITVYLILLFTDGTSKRIVVELHHNGLLTVHTLYSLRNSLARFILYPTYYDTADCNFYYSNIHHCKFNCIKKIVIHNK